MASDVWIYVGMCAIYVMLSFKSLSLCLKLFADLTQVEINVDLDEEKTKIFCILSHLNETTLHFGVGLSKIDIVI